jgi:putative transposase
MKMHIEHHSEILYYGERLLVVMGEDGKEVLLRRQADRKILSLTYEELVEAYGIGQFEALGPVGKGGEPAPVNQLFEFAPESHKAEARRRHSYVKAMLAGNVRTYSGDLKKFAQSHKEKIDDPEKAPCPRTLLDWKSAFLLGGCTLQSLLPRHRSKGRRGLLDDPHLANLWDEAKTTFYLTQRRPNKLRFQKHLKYLIDQYNQDSTKPGELRCPDRSTVCRWLQDEDLYATLARQRGEKYAKDFFGEPGEGFVASRILELVEADGQWSPNRLYDPETDQYRQPMVLVAIDSFSRAVVGYAIGWAENTEEVLALYENMLWPKGPAVDGDGVILSDVEWPVFGIPERIIADNGQGFRSKRVEVALAEIGCVNHAAIPRRPKNKPLIERFYRTLMTTFYKEPQVFIEKNSTEYRDRDPRKEGVLTLDQYRAGFQKWLTEVYMNTRHTGIQETPLQRWTASAEKYPPKPVRNPSARALFSAKVVDRTLERRGVRVNNRWYCSKEVNELFCRGNAPDKVSVYLTGAEPDFVYVFDPLSTRMLRADFRPQHSSDSPIAPPETSEEAEARELGCARALGELHGYISECETAHRAQYKNKRRPRKRPQGQTESPTDTEPQHPEEQMNPGLGWDTALDGPAVDDDADLPVERV